MAEVVKMPRLSDTMTDGVVAKWHKKIGDKVNEGDLLADIETDKATMEFESFQEGFLLHIGVKENGTAKVDSILAILGDENEDISSILSENDKEKSEKNTSSNDTAINKNDIDSYKRFIDNNTQKITTQYLGSKEEFVLKSKDKISFPSFLYQP